jgi:uncharacterized protein YqfB (UPF0267 family)
MLNLKSYSLKKKKKKSFKNIQLKEINPLEHITIYSSHASYPHLTLNAFFGVFCKQVPEVDTFSVIYQELSIHWVIW